MGMASPYLKTLELEQHGLTWLQPEIPMAHPLSEGRAAVLHRSLEETVAAFSTLDVTVYRLFFENLIVHADNLYADLLKPFGLPRHPVTMGRFGVGAGLSASAFAALFQSEEARALFAGNAGHSVMAFHLPLTAAIALVLQLCAHAVGWPIPEGGSQSIANAMVRKLESLGGEVRCGWKVEALSELPPAKAYLFDVSPRNLARICGDALPSNYRNKLEAYRHGPGVFKVDYALNAPIPWANEACRKAGTIHVGGTFEEIADSECAAWDGNHTDKPFVLVAQPTITDPTRAPEGKHVAWAYCHVPSGSTKDRLDIINAQIERFAPGFRDTILATHTMNCAEMESYNANYIGGDVIGGVTDMMQLFTRPVGLLNPYATPNPSIFICSASTPPGGGVHGMCGYWAAETVLRRVSRL
jgi:phytoene dehydrogenase-like protein